MGTARDYGWSGDYDYTLVTAIVDDASGRANPGTYDYDYGTINPIPETAVTTGRSSTNVKRENTTTDGTGRDGRRDNSTDSLGPAR